MLNPIVLVQTLYVLNTHKFLGNYKRTLGCGTNLPDYLLLDIQRTKRIKKLNGSKKLEGSYLN